MMPIELTRLRAALDSMQTSDYFIFLGLGLVGAGVGMIWGLGAALMVLGVILLTIGLIAALPPKRNE